MTTFPPVPVTCDAVRDKCREMLTAALQMDRECPCPDGPWGWPPPQPTAADPRCTWGSLGTQILGSWVLLPVLDGMQGAGWNRREAS